MHQDSGGSAWRHGQVTEIVTKVAGGTETAAIMKEYGINRELVSRIVSRRAHKNIVVDTELVEKAKSALKARTIAKEKLNDDDIIKIFIRMADNVTTKAIADEMEVSKDLIILVVKRMRRKDVHVPQSLVERAQAVLASRRKSEPVTSVADEALGRSSMINETVDQATVVDHDQGIDVTVVDQDLDQVTVVTRISKLEANFLRVVGAVVRIDNHSKEELDEAV